MLVAMIRDRKKDCNRPRSPYPCCRRKSRLSFLAWLPFEPSFLCGEKHRKLLQATCIPKFLKQSAVFLEQIQQPLLVVDGHPGLLRFG